jgi:hypothetical protein
VLGLSKTGKRVSIKTDPLPQLSGRQYWARVTPAKLSPLKTVLEFEGERHTLST